MESHDRTSPAARFLTRLVAGIFGSRRRTGGCQHNADSSSRRRGEVRWILGDLHLFTTPHLSLAHQLAKSGTPTSTLEGAVSYLLTEEAVGTRTTLGDTVVWGEIVEAFSPKVQRRWTRSGLTGGSGRRRGWVFRRILVGVGPEGRHGKSRGRLSCLPATAR
jgi:hypothetical protein